MHNVRIKKVTSRGFEPEFAALNARAGFAFAGLLLPAPGRNPNYPMHCTAGNCR